MTVVSISVRRRHLNAVKLSPTPDFDLLAFDKKQIKPETEKELLLIDRTIIERCEISVGDELNNADVRELIKVSACFRAKEKAIWYLSKCDRSCKSLFEKLCETFGEIPSQFAVDEMIRRGYIDDMKYAKHLAESLNNSGISKRAAMQKLYVKGVDRDTARTAVELFFDEDEVEKAVKLIEKKYINKLDSEDNVRRTVQALQRRGFSYSAISAALKTFKEL